MFRGNILAAGLIALLPAAAIPVLCAQSQAPKAKSAAVFSGAPRSYLGIGALDIPEDRAKALGLKEPQGVEVTWVEDDSPADKAGLKKGDVILEFNGQPVEGGAQFVRMVQETPVGRKATMQIWRNSAKQAITATIGSRQDRSFSFAIPGLPTGPFPPEPPMMPDTPHDMLSWRSSALGVETEGLNSQLAEFFGVHQGVLVRAVTKGSSAETAGLKAGDVITKINGQTVSSPRNITSYLHQSGRDITLTVVRNRKEITLNVKLSQNLPRLDDYFRGLQPESREIL